MQKNDKILILGGSGLVGSSLKRIMVSHGYTNILTPPHSELELLDQRNTLEYFSKNKPQHVFLAAARVGGIHANNTYRADFIFENLEVQNNVFNAAFKTDVDKFLFLGSSCIYPAGCPQPIKEEYLLTSKLEQTNEPYAVAKIAGLKMAESFRRQYGKKYYAVMPTNLYGEGDNYHPMNSHVIPGLINRMREVIRKNETTFEVWGTGKPRREFLYVDDMAEACLKVMTTTEEIPYWINIGTGEDISIGELAQLIARIMGFSGKIVFNTDYPDGTPQKLLDVTKLKGMGWKPKYTLEQGLIKTIKELSL